MSPIPKISTILYATDLGENTRPVFRHAISQARKNDAHIVMVHVVEPLSESAMSVINTYLPHDETEKSHKTAMQDILGSMQKRLEDFCADELDAANVRSSRVKEILVVGGHPSEELLRIVEERNVDMIVMGRSARSLLGSTIMGSTVRRVTKHASVPVLMVPND